MYKSTKTQKVVVNLNGVGGIGLSIYSNQKE